MKRPTPKGHAPPDVEDSVRYQLLEEAMEHLQAALTSLPDRCHSSRGNALLNLALGALVQQYGQWATAQLITCVYERLTAGEFPECRDRALDPFRLDG